VNLNLLIFVGRFIRWIAVAITEPQNEDWVWEKYGPLGFTWFFGLIFLYLLLEDLYFILRYNEILEEFTNVEIEQPNLLILKLVVAQQILFPLMRLYWFNTIYYRYMSVKWNER
jgi:hypothetical protein